MLSAILRGRIVGVSKVFHAQLSCIAASAREFHDVSRSPRPERFVPMQTRAAACPQSAHAFHSSALKLKRRKVPEPPPRELDLLRYDMRELGKSPKPARILGLCGILPFVAPPLVMAMTETYLPELAFAQVAYGASILAFLGGARWGFAMPEGSPSKPDWINLANSVVPPIAASLAMMLYGLLGDLTPAAITVIMGLGIALHYDLALIPTYPSWLKAQWAILTVVAFFSLMATIILDGAFPEMRMFSEK